MTGPEHYTTAETLLGKADFVLDADSGAWAHATLDERHAARAGFLGAAQAHATLALAAATIDATYGEPTSPSIERWGSALHPEGTTP